MEFLRVSGLYTALKKVEVQQRDITIDIKCWLVLNYSIKYSKVLFNKVPVSHPGEPQ